MRLKLYSVNQSSSTVSSIALTSETFYDSRGNVIKTSSPGGLVHKSVFDGAGRTTVSYVTDGGGDTAYADASSVSGDAVLEQTEYSYNKNGAVVLTVTHTKWPGTAIDYDDAFAVNAAMFHCGTSGMIHFQASADFYEGLALPAAFVPGNMPGGASHAGLLPSTIVDPKLVGGTVHPLVRTITVTWDCCTQALSKSKVEIK